MKNPTKQDLKRHRLKTSPASIIPGGLSYEVIENVFCQQRALNDGRNINHFTSVAVEQYYCDF